MARGLPVASRFFTSTMVQLSAELEESARVHGASWLRTFVRIWVPLLRWRASQKCDACLQSSNPYSSADLRRAGRCVTDAA